MLGRISPKKQVEVGMIWSTGRVHESGNLHLVHQLAFLSSVLGTSWLLREGQ